MIFGSKIGFGAYELVRDTGDQTAGIMLGIFGLGLLGSGLFFLIKALKLKANKPQS